MLTFGAGIGAAMTLALAQAGADIISAQRDTSNTSTRDAVQAVGRKCEIIECDLTDSESVKTTFERGVKAMGNVDILINCGGMLQRQDTVDILEADWNRVRGFPFL